MGYVLASITGLAELLAPRRCPACELLLTEGERGFCGGCELLIERAPPAFRPPAVSGAAFSYGGPIAAAIQALKYRARTEYAPLLGEMLAESALTVAGRVDLVVPLPLHPRRLRSRGFNQSVLIAAPVARMLAVPLDVMRLRRVRDTETQAGLTRAGRTSNLRGAFCASDGGGQRVLLIDDVRTTGATFAAAAEALLSANHSLVMTLALARADL
jgi:ComF family protein